jgi:hypothetical protein
MKSMTAFNYTHNLINTVFVIPLRKPAKRVKRKEIPKLPSLFLLSKGKIMPSDNRKKFVKNLKGVR